MNHMQPITRRRMQNAGSKELDMQPLSVTPSFSSKAHYWTDIGA